MDKIDAIKVPRALPRPAPAADITRVLAAICSRRPRKDVSLDRLRDRVLFETAYACGLYVEDLDLRLDDEHVRIHGKGGTVRTVLLDDRGYVALLRLYLAAPATPPGRCSAPASTGRAGRCPTILPTTAGRATAARPGSTWRSTSCATPRPPSFNSGVSIEAIRQRLGHASTETNQLYALMDDKVADAEIRAARRRRGRSAS